MDSKLTSLQHDFFEKLGLVAAPMLFKFANYVGDNAKHPIKVSYRRGVFIKHALDHVGIENSPLWINKSLSHSLWNSSIENFCIDSGLNKPFTFVDNGYNGTISKAMMTRAKCKEDNMCKYCDSDMKSDSCTPPITTDFKTLFMLRRGQPELAKALMSTDQKNAAFLITDTEIFGRKLVEQVPMRYKKYGFLDFVFINGKYTIRPERASEQDHMAFTAFADGLTSGYDFCNPDDKKFQKYLDVMNNAGGVAYQNFPSPWGSADTLDMKPLDKLCVEIEDVYK